MLEGSFYSGVSKIFERDEVLIHMQNISLPAVEVLK